MSKSIEDKLKSNMERLLVKQEETIREFGYSFTLTGYETPQGMLGMLYTVGLAEKGLPELIVFGLPTETAAAFVRNAVDILRSGSLEYDIPTEKVTQGHVVFKKVPPAATDGFLNMASNRAGHLVEAIQIIWPDPEGLFPWEAGFQESMRFMQPELYNLGNAAEPTDTLPGPVLH